MPRRSRLETAAAIIRGPASLTRSPSVGAIVCLGFGLDAREYQVVGHIRSCGWPLLQTCLDGVRFTSRGIDPGQLVLVEEVKQPPYMRKSA